jgi:tRNA pseudouridine38-40 synthase
MGTALYKIILAYNGGAFAGYQRQAKARTVQAELETGLRKIGWQGKHVLSAGRTDAGVHAHGQVVSFQLDWNHSTDDLQNALNYYLPKDMAVKQVSQVADDFHPRYDAKSRHYCYQIFCQPVRDPLREDFAWRVWPPVAVERMNAAAQDLIGLHDFKAFGSPMKADGVTLREIFSAEWTGDGDTWQFHIRANAFLYHMVRRIAYVLVVIGQNEANVNLIAESLNSAELVLTGLAPAAGLILEDVVY